MLIESLPVTLVEDGGSVKICRSNLSWKGRVDCEWRSKGLICVVSVRFAGSDTDSVAGRFVLSALMQGGKDELVVGGADLLLEKASSFNLSGI
jgi:hypothetical protein